METDLRKIEQLARQREDENRRFRCSLKASDLPVARIDALVMKLYQEVSARRVKFRSRFTPYPSEQMEMYPVSDIVNSPGNDTPECINSFGEHI